MAFETIEPFGDAHMDQRIKVLAAWIVTFLSSSKSYGPDDIVGISPPADPDAEDSDAADERFEISDLKFESSESSSEAILRDMREQNLFR